MPDREFDDSKDSSIVVDDALGFNCYSVSGSSKMLGLEIEFRGVQLSCIGSLRERARECEEEDGDALQYDGQAGREELMAITAVKVDEMEKKQE